MQTTRAFIAIEIPEGIRQRISAVSVELGSGGVSLVPEKNIHITLLFLGDIAEEKAEEVKARLSKIKASHFQVSVEGISAFSKQHPKVVFADVSLGSKEMTALHKSISASLSDLVAIEEREFTPHATIARTRSYAADAAVKEFILKHGNEKFGTFDCGSFVLKSSRLGNGPPEYTTLCSVGLGL